MHQASSRRPFAASIEPTREGLMTVTDTGSRVIVSVARAAVHAARETAKWAMGYSESRVFRTSSSAIALVDDLSL